jgi:hypothetical protein
MNTNILKTSITVLGLLTMSAWACFGAGTVRQD